MKIEPIVTDDEAYEEYEEQMKKEGLERENKRREHPKATEQYEHPIGPERFREKVKSKAIDIKENIKNISGKAYEKVKHEIGEIKRKHKENVEYEEEVERQERKVKSNPDYIKKKLEHGMYLEEMRAKKQGNAPRSGSINTKSATVTMGGYRSAYSNRSTAPRGGGFGGSYKSAYTGQMWGSEPRHIVRQPVSQMVKQPSRPTTTIKHEPIKIHVFGGGPMPKIGNFGSSTPKIGGGGKRFETPMIGSGLLGSLPKIGKPIKHKGHVRSMSHKTHVSNIGYVPQLKIGEVPKIGFGLKKRGMKK